MRLDKGQIEVVDDTMADILCLKTPAQRIAIGFKIWQSTRKMLSAILKSDHPDWDEEKIQEEVTQRLLHGTP